MKDKLQSLFCGFNTLTQCEVCVFACMLLFALNCHSVTPVFFLDDYLKWEMTGLVNLVVVIFAQPAETSGRHRTKNPFRRKTRHIYSQVKAAEVKYSFFSKIATEA